MLKLNNINKKLEDFSIKNIDLEIGDKEYFVILGPTGTGKTILLELIAGLRSIASGKIIYREKNITELPPEDRNISMVYQDYMLFPHLNVRENIKFGMEVRNWSRSAQTRHLREIVELFGISHLLQRDVTTLSGGEQQRVALARALIISPNMLLLDEPLSALDPETQKKFQEDLQRIHSQLQTTTIHVTHNFEEALKLGDRIAVMRDGEIVQVGYPQEIFKKPSSNFVAEFVGLKNIIAGEIVRQGEDTHIKITEDLKIIGVKTADKKRGEQVELTINPEDIIISQDKFASSARNTFSGKVIKIEEKLRLIEITIDIGVELTAYITRFSLENMDLQEGSSVYITFKASAIHIF